MDKDLELKILVYPSGELIYQNKKFKVALGKNGVVSIKSEGDGATPAGCFPIREIYYRADRLDKPKTIIPVKELRQNEGWCDDPDNSNYNKIGYNDNPPIPGKGSAIFIHIARPDYTPTAGCVALALPDLIELIASINVNTMVCILEIL